MMENLVIAKAREETASLRRDECGLELGWRRGRVGRRDQGPGKCGTVTLSSSEAALPKETNPYTASQDLLRLCLPWN